MGLTLGWSSQVRFDAFFLLLLDGVLHSTLISELPRILFRSAVLSGRLAGRLGVHAFCGDGMMVMAAGWY